VHFIVATRTRLAENAILEANGLEPNVLRTGIAIEQGIVLIFAFAVGAALAVTLTIWLLPPLQFGSAASDLIPPTTLHADWVALGVGAAVTVAVIATLGWAVRRAASGLNTIEELRRLG
jgi:ABC-type antimicrobial peptide transport system permease subunit